MRGLGAGWVTSGGLVGFSGAGSSASVGAAWGSPCGGAAVTDGAAADWP